METVSGVTFFKTIFYFQFLLSSKKRRKKRKKIIFLLPWKGSGQSDIANVGRMGIMPGGANSWLLHLLLLLCLDDVTVGETAMAATAVDDNCGEAGSSTDG
jgi:hypothetical protein